MQPSLIYVIKYIVNSIMHAMLFLFSMNNFIIDMHLIVQQLYVGAQSLSGSVLELRQKDQWLQEGGSSLTCVTTISS